MDETFENIFQGNVQETPQTSTSGETTQTNAPAGSPDLGGAGGQGAAPEKTAPAAPQAPEAFDKQKWNEFLDKLDPDLGIDKQAIAGFGEVIEKFGLNAEAASGLLNYALDAADQYKKSSLAEAEKTLRQEWGRDYDNQLAACKNVVDRIDKQMDGRFRRAIEVSGLGVNVDFIRGMKMIAAELSEDALGASTSGGFDDREETPFEALSKIFNK